LITTEPPIARRGYWILASRHHAIQGVSETIVPQGFGIVVVHMSPTFAPEFPRKIDCAAGRTLAKFHSGIDNDGKCITVVINTLRWFVRVFAAKLSGAAPHNMSTNRMSKPPQSIAPRGLIRLGLAPAPWKLPGLERNVYDRPAPDAAMSARAVTV